MDNFKIIGIRSESKYHDFLIEDADGDRDIIRFDRKTEHQAMMSDLRGIRATDRLFESYLAELMIDRANMPQIHDIYKFITFCRSKCVIVKKTVNPNDCEPVQAINQSKVDALVAMQDRSSSKFKKPIVLASDMKIVDGHHRWAAHKQVGDNVMAYIMSVPFTKAYNIAMMYYANNK